jgi:hypothetical protein
VRPGGTNATGTFGSPALAAPSWPRYPDGGATRATPGTPTLPSCAPMNVACDLHEHNARRASQRTPGTTPRPETRRIQSNQLTHPQATCAAHSPARAACSRICWLSRTLCRAGIARFDHNALYIYPAIPGTMSSSTPTGRVGTALATATFRGLAGDTLFIDHLDSNAMTVRFVRCNAHSCRCERALALGIEKMTGSFNT